VSLASGPFYRLHPEKSKRWTPIQMLIRSILVAVPAGDPGSLVQSVGRAAAILRYAASDLRGVTAREVSEALGLRRPTVYHLLHTLVAEGLLARGQDRRYRLGLSVGQLAEAFRRSLSPPEHLVGHIRSLSLQTGEPTYITGWVDADIVLLARVPGQHAVSVGEFPLGMVGDAHARASGKLLLGLAEPETRHAYLVTHPPVPLTANTIVDRGALDLELEEIRARGYALDREEFNAGVCCLAAPLDADVSYAISLAAPRERFEEHFDEYLDAILETAAAASASLPPALGAPA
jgi:IclR family acetate operon transcriptional repressor